MQGSAGETAGPGTGVRAGVHSRYSGELKGGCCFLPYLREGKEGPRLRWRNKRQHAVLGTNCHALDLCDLVGQEPEGPCFLGSEAVADQCLSHSWKWLRCSSPQTPSLACVLHMAGWPCVTASAAWGMAWRRWFSRLLEWKVRLREEKPPAPRVHEEHLSDQVSERRKREGASPPFPAQGPGGEGFSSLPLAREEREASGWRGEEGWQGPQQR